MIRREFRYLNRSKVFLMKPYLKPAFLFTFAIAILICFSFVPGEKKYPFDQWKQEDFDKANTAKDVDYMNEEEKKVVLYTNLVRLNPKLFGATYAQKFIDSSGTKSSYAKSLLSELKKAEARQVLEPDSTLSSTAEDHARATGKLGTTGHSGKKGRINEVKQQYNIWGENCSYGYDRALDIVMQLLIDDKISGTGHRKNIMEKRFTHIGVGIEPHRKYRWNCVQDFAGTPVK